MVEEFVAWDAHTVCRSDGCLLWWWTKVVMPRLLCGYGILLFDRALHPGHHRSLRMRILLVLHFLQLTETDQLTFAPAKRIYAGAVLFSLCCSCALWFQAPSIDLRVHWQERRGSRSEVGNRGRRWGK